MRTKIAAACVAILAAAACNPDVTASPAEEMILAQQAQVIARDVAATHEVGYPDWLRRLFAALRTTDDPEAQACLAEARDLREQARVAFEAGDRETARRLLRESFLKVLCAVVAVFPNAAERTGAAVDQVVARIEERLGDREAPRIRGVLAHVKAIRADATEALGAGDEVTALALNLRAIQILHWLVDHIREPRIDHDRTADEQLDAVGI